MTTLPLVLAFAVMALEFLPLDHGLRRTLPLVQQALDFGIADQAQIARSEQRIGVLKFPYATR